jgi:hypothetical protein
MKPLIITCHLILLSFLFSLPIKSTAQNLIGFTPYYRSFPEDFDFTLYTHIIFFTVWPDSSDSFIWPAGNDSIKIFNKYESIRNRDRMILSGPCRQPCTRLKPVLLFPVILINYRLVVTGWFTCRKGTLLCQASRVISSLHHCMTLKEEGCLIIRLNLLP